jgi:hypothetical protein
VPHSSFDAGSGFLEDVHEWQYAGLQSEAEVRNSDMRVLTLVDGVGRELSTRERNALVRLPREEKDFSR